MQSFSSTSRLVAAALALSGLAWACTTTTYVYPAALNEDGGAQEGDDASGQADAGMDSRMDAQGTSSADAKVDAPTWNGPACARPKPALSAFRYAPPHRIAACNARDLAFVEQKLRAGVSYRTVEAQLFTRPCAECIFSEFSDSTWGPIVFTSATGPGFKNFGGCYVVAGQSQACGEAYSKLDYCARGVCDRCPTDEEIGQCVNAAITGDGPCRAERDAQTFLCGAGAASCGDLFQAIATMCGNGLP